MQRYFSYICDGTDVQADWRRSFTYGQALNAIDILQGSLTCPSYTDTGPTFSYGDFDTPPLKSPFTTRWGYGGSILYLNPRRPHGGILLSYDSVFQSDLTIWRYFCRSINLLWYNSVSQSDLTIWSYFCEFVFLYHITNSDMIIRPHCSVHPTVHHLRV